MLARFSRATSSRRFVPRTIVGAALTTLIAAAALPAQPTGSTALPSAIARMQERGPEAEALARRVGTWDVVMTLRPGPDAAPVVTSGMIAERTMVGPFLAEVMKPAPGADHPDFRRLSYLTYNRVEGRWQYVSMDTRFPVGIMPAWSHEPAAGRTLTLQFDGLGFVGFGTEVEGRLIRSSYVVTRECEDREIARQYWTQADGSGRTWLAVQYEYTRRRSARSGSGSDDCDPAERNS